MDGGSDMEYETGRGENVQIKLPGWSKSISLWLPPDWSVSSIKNSFLQRIISTSRDFPPCCGGSASLHRSSEDQSEIAFSMKKNLEQQERQDKPLPEHKVDSVEVVLKCQSVSSESIGDNVRAADKKIRPSCEIVLCRPDKKSAKRPNSPKGSEGFHHLAKRRNCSDTPAEGPGTSNVVKGDEHDDPNEIAARERVKEILQLFRANCWKLIHENNVRRVDLEAAKILKKNRKYVNTVKNIGHVRGVNVGDRFHYRIELAIVGLHRPPQGGIDYIKVGEQTLAASIVASGRYANSLDSNVLIYMGHGGNVAYCRKKPVEDQKLKKGNLALKNSIYAQNPVRVIRTKDKESSNARTSIMDEIFVYDGLYLVQECWRELGPNGKRVFKFRLERIPDQPHVSWQ